MDDNVYANIEDDGQLEILPGQPGTQVKKKKKKPETGPPPLPPSHPPPLPSGAADRCYRWTAVGLGILCALLLGLSIGLAVWLLTERGQLLTNQSHLLEERDQLLTNHSILLDVRDQLLTNQSNLIEERRQLLTNHINLLKERDQLMRYKLCFEERPTCPSGWALFRCKCYYNSMGYKTWSGGRTYCQSLGGDLALITTPETQRFLNEIDYAGWIGLKKDNGTWRWIDDTPVSTWFWNPGQPDGYSEDCVALNHRGNWNETWHDHPCNAHQWSICEKPAI